MQSCLEQVVWIRADLPSDHPLLRGEDYVPYKETQELRSQQCQSGRHGDDGSLCADFFFNQLNQSFERIRVGTNCVNDIIVSAVYTLDCKICQVFHINGLD